MFVHSVISGKKKRRESDNQNGETSMTKTMNEEWSIFGGNKRYIYISFKDRYIIDFEKCIYELVGS